MSRIIAGQMSYGFSFSRLIDGNYLSPITGARLIERTQYRTPYAAIAINSNT